MRRFFDVSYKVARRKDRVAPEFTLAWVTSVELVARPLA